MKIFKFLIFIIALSIICLSFLCISKSNNKAITKSELGELLFYDNILSANQTKACASCHDPKFGFSDGYKKSIGMDGYNVLHNAPGLQNISSQVTYTWADSSIKSLYQQVNNPMFNTHPNELGWSNNENLILGRIKNKYGNQFKNIFNTDEVTTQQVKECIVEFEKTLNSFESAYDQYLAGKKDALNEQQKAGMALFFSKKLACSNCHKGNNFGASKSTDFYNTGLYNVHDENTYPSNDLGLFNITKEEKDNGKFRVPSLRNVGITQPYMHDGSVENLSDVIDLYAHGGRVITKGPLEGDGRKNKYKHPLIRGFTITQQQKINLIAFLESLTDYAFLKKHQQKQHEITH